MKSGTIRKLIAIVMVTCLPSMMVLGQDLASLPKQWKNSHSISNFVLHGNAYRPPSAINSSPVVQPNFSTTSSSLSWITQPPGAAPSLDNLDRGGSSPSMPKNQDQPLCCPTSSASDRNGQVDPSNPTQLACHLMFQWDWNQLSNRDGDLLAFKINPFIPFTLGQQQFLFNVELPLPMHAGLTGISHNSGIGDTRLKLFWLIPANRNKIQAVVPSFDAFAPTGDVDRGLGGGQWIFMPNLVLALQPAEKLSIYPFIRYVHSDGLATELVPDIPGLPASSVDVFATSDVRALNLEVPLIVGLENAVMNWVGVTPDYLQNFSGNRSGTLTMKYESGVSLTETLFLIGEFWHPVTSSTGDDFTFKLKLDWYPRSNRCNKCRQNLFRRGCRCRT